MPSLLALYNADERAHLCSRQLPALLVGVCRGRSRLDGVRPGVTQSKEKPVSLWGLITLAQDYAHLVLRR
jgi:hypothetical protein